MDYVLDGIYERLSPKAKMMFTVVEHVRAYQDNKRCLKNQFFHSVKVLSKHAHLSRTYGMYSLKELEEWGIITRNHRNGYWVFLHKPTKRCIKELDFHIYHCINLDLR